MSRPMVAFFALLIVSAFGTFLSAKDTKVVVTVTRPDANAEVIGSPPFEGVKAAVDVAILLDGRPDQSGQEPALDDRPAVCQGQKERPDTDASRGAVRIRQYAPTCL